MNRVLVAGGYGTFGTHVCRELVARGVAVTVAGRNGDRAKTLAESLGQNCDSQAIDLNQPDACRDVLQDCKVVANCAGPFQSLDATLLEACLQTGCHYADINDHRGYANMIRGYDERFRDKGLLAVHGCSSLPGISGALVLLAKKRSESAVERTRVTLFIGNKSPKGEAALRSLLEGFGKSIAAPQGEIKCFRDREVVPLPPPFGRRGVFNFQSPDYDMLPSLVETNNYSVKLGFELRMGTYLFALLAATGLHFGRRTAKLLLATSSLTAHLGCTGAAVMAELFFADGTETRVALVAREDGQRMAALPCALAAKALLEGRNIVPGVKTAYEYLGAESLIDAEVAAGFEIYQDNVSTVKLPE